MLRPMASGPPTFVYDVALSFAGEERRFVQEVAERLKAAGVRIFYDEDQTTSLWGENLVELLDKVYRHESRYAVMFVSRAYSTKMWTKHERKSLQARALREASAYILPVRLDDTELEGLLPTIGYLDGHRFGPAGITDQILQKLDHKTTPTPQWTSGVPTTPDMMRSLIVQRPPGWEYLLYGGALVQGRERLEGKYRDHAMGYARSTGRYVDSLHEANVVLKQGLDRGQYVTSQFGRVLDPQVQEQAFGPPGIPGDPDRIMHIAERFCDVYEGYMDIAAELRGTSLPDEFDRTRDILAQYWDQPIVRMRSFVDEFNASVHDLPQRIARGETGITIEIIVKLEIPDALSRAFDKEYKRLKRRLK